MYAAGFAQPDEDSKKAAHSGGKLPRKKSSSGALIEAEEMATGKVSPQA